MPLLYIFVFAKRYILRVFGKAIFYVFLPHHIPCKNFSTDALDITFTLATTSNLLSSSICNQALGFMAFLLKPGIKGQEDWMKEKFSQKKVKFILKRYLFCNGTSSKANIHLQIVLSDFVLIVASHFRVESPKVRLWWNWTDT